MLNVLNVQHCIFIHFLKKYKMRTSIIIYIFLILCYSSKAQRKPEFEFTLYGEDAKGHKDSVVIGYHREANNEWQIEPTFGDVSIANQKFDSVFEMRVHKHDYIYPVLDQIIKRGDIAKHITLKYGFNRAFPPPDEPCAPYGLSQFGFILIKVKYPPIKFSWNKSRFSYTNNKCATQTFMIDNEYFTQEGPPEINRNYPYPPTYLSEKDNLVDSLKQKYLGDRLAYKYLDGTIDTLQGNYTIIFRNYSIFRNVATDEIKGTEVKTYPNPCRETMNVNLPESFERVKVNIYSTDGALMQATHTMYSTVVSIDTGPLSIGSHIVQIIGNNGKQYVGKFVKQ
jgi:Secretion system C-terminal sorting domain